jgi:hypothetical protein
MALKCEICGAENPASNRYCGQCGKSLWQIKYPEASADLPPEVIEFDNQIPLIAEEGTDRRLHTPPELLEQVHDHLEQEAEVHDALHHGSEPHSEVRAKEDAERQRLLENPGEFLRWDISELESNASKGETVNLGLKPAAASPPAQQNFLSEGERPTRTGVSGPSFLGLTDDSVSEYADEELEPESHVRRNVALAILAAVVILVGVQWRSIRDYGLAYIQNGSMEVKPHDQGAVANPPAVAADNTGRDLSLPPANAKAGAPQPVERSPNANRDLPVAASSSNPDRIAPSSPPTASAEQPPAMGAPVSDMPNADLPDKAPKKESPTISHTTGKPRPYSPPAPRPSSAVPGADEMSRAERASDAEARAAWLWKAVGKGNPQAPVELAKMYEQGSGVVRSCDQAEVLLRSAAAKGNAQAKLSLKQIRLRGGCSGR